MQSQTTTVRRGALAAALALASAPAFAQDAATRLDEIVVTATRTARTQDETLAAITVIDRADIERLQPASLPELLRGTPGLSIASNGGLGKQTSLFLRGTEADQVLVLVDGIKIGSATAGAAAIQDIPLEQIERIEIVRGPFSSLYGSEALGGVIQIFTRRPEGTFAPHASLGVGSYSTRRASAGAGGRVGRGWYSIAAAHERTDGINACRASFVAGCFADEPDRDGYRNTSLSLQGGYRFSDAWDAEARVLRAEGENAYDGGFVDASDVVQQVAGARLRFAPSDALALTFNAGQSRDESDDFKDGAFIGVFDTQRDLGSLQADIGAGEGLVSIGFDWQREEVDSTIAFDQTRRINRGLFGQWQRTFGAHGLQASLRRDDDSQFGGQTTGSALWGWSFTETLRLTASYGTAYRAPTFNELYFPGFNNPGLQPETSRSAELGLRGKLDDGDWSLSAFQTQVDDLIAFDATTFRPVNVDRARIRGVEAALGAKLADWTLRGSATWLDPRNDGDTVNRGNQLPRRARQTARIDADRAFGGFSVGGTVFAAGARYDDLANTTRLGGYATVDLRLAWSLGDDWSLQLAANNVFDRRYETAAFFNQPGRNYMFTVRWRPAP